MSAFYIAAGLNHFFNPDFYMPIMPQYIPITFHLQLIYLSGIFEVLFGLMLLYPGTRQTAAICIVILLIVIFPANIQMAVNNFHETGWSFWISIIRLPIQILLILWANLFIVKKKKLDKVKLKDHAYTE